MQERLDSCLPTRNGSGPEVRHRHESFHRVKNLAVAGLAVILFAAHSGIAHANFEAAPIDEYGAYDNGAPPMSQYGNGQFFSQDLGTMLRVGYTTQGYGQDHDGNLAIGTFQTINYSDSILFFDGQVTLNDEQGAGFNLGLGYRWLAMAPYSLNTETVQGISIWADGTSTEEDNFFPGVGVSYESLGELWDVRVNGYVPVGDDQQVGDFVPTGEVGYQGFFLSELTQAVVEHSYYGGELEVARRLGRERDAWAFAGPYFLANDIEDTVGYEVGVRGYAYPDLLLQFAVTDDEIFATNATFSIVWFVGRTRTNFQPTCGVPDRMREPVMRNNYIALSRSSTFGGIPLTDPDGNAIRVVHVDSNAPDGGNGSFENPLNNLNDVNANSQVGDIILAHSESVFTGQSILLRNEQRFLGEGNNFVNTVETEEMGVVDLPETSLGSGALARPMILDAIGAAITLADANEVANFDIDGNNITQNAIAAGPNGAGNPNIHDLTISDTTGDGITLSPLVRTDDDGDQTVAFNVTIDNVTFNSVGDGVGTDSDIRLDAATTVDVDDPNNTLLETIMITNVTSNNSQGRGVTLLNTHDGQTATIQDYVNTGATAGAKLHFEGTGTNEFSGNVNITNAEITGGTGYALNFDTISEDSAIVVDNLSYDGLGGAAGGIQFTDYDGLFDIRNSDLTGGTLEGVAIRGASDGVFDFESTNTLMNIDGTSFLIDGGGADEFTGIVTVAHAIENDTGRVVQIQGLSGGTNEPSITFSGNITETGQGMLIASNDGGSILFSGSLLDFDATDDEAIRLLDNTGTDITFSGRIDIDNTTEAGFVATGGGNLAVTNTGNSITTTTGRAIDIQDMTIANTGVNFSEINSTGANNAIFLEDNTGGPIVLGTVGDDPGESGTIANTTGDAIVIRNSANVTVSGLEINNSGAVAGVRVEKSTTGTQTVNLNDLEINGGAFGVNTVGGTGTLNMTVNDTTINGATNTALNFDNVDTGTIQVNDSTLDGNNVAGSAGVLITGSNASFTFNNGTVVQEMADTDFEVNGGTGSISMAGEIINSTTENPGDTTGRSVHVRNITGGSVTFSAASSIDDDNQGLLVEDNTGGTISFLGDNEFDTGANDAVTIADNTGADITLTGLDITTTTGTGFTATGGGDLTVSGTTNTITKNGAGTALRIDGMNIVGGANFQSVNATGATNAIVLNNVTGSAVTIGNQTGAANSGGTLTTTGDAIQITDVENVVLNHVRIMSAGGDGVAVTHSDAFDDSMDVTIRDLNLISATGIGVDVVSDKNDNTLDFDFRLIDSNIQSNVDIAVTGSSDFGLLVEGTTIDTVDAGDIAFELTFSDDARNGQVTFRDGNDFTADNESALFIDAFGGNSKTVTLLVEDSTFSNSGAGNDAAADFMSRGNSLFNATIRNNTFDNSNGGGRDFNITSDGAQARMRLNLGGDDPSEFNTAAGVGNYNLNELNGSDFDVYERDDTFNDLRNSGSVVPSPNAAAFDNMLVPPPLPTVP